MDWHLDWYIANDPESWAKKKTPRLFQSPIPGPRPPTPGFRLTTAERKRILLTHIFGVDIDPQAVEVTKLSLLLKVLEGESQQTIDSQLRLFHERALPDLNNNIKCGNSLIGPDFYDNQQMSFLEEEERYRINVFDWQVEFPDIMKSGGFDAVVGNPPWGATFTDAELEYLRTKYSRVVERMVDSYIYFLDAAIRVGTPQAMLGFIIPGTILNQTDARSVRALLLNRGLSAVVNLGRGIFGPRVLNTSTILVSTPATDESPLIVQDLSDQSLEDRRRGLMSVRSVPRREWQDLVTGDPHFTFFASDVAGTALLSRLRQRLPALETILNGTIQRGVSPDVAPAHVISEQAASERNLEQELLRPSISGHRVKRYRPCVPDQWIIYTTKDTDIERYPNALSHLREYRKLNTCREVAEGKHPWWALHRPRDPKIFASPKIIGLTTTKTIELVFDESLSLCVTDAMYVFSVAPEYDPMTTMCILQSRAFLFLYRTANQGEARVIPQVKASKLKPLPVPAIPKEDPRSMRLSPLARELESMYGHLSTAKTDHERITLHRQIDATERQIDQLVYELYGLTDEEIRIVERPT